MPGTTALHAPSPGGLRRATVQGTDNQLAAGTDELPATATAGRALVRVSVTSHHAPNDPRLLAVKPISEPVLTVIYRGTLPFQPA